MFKPDNILSQLEAEITTLPTPELLPFDKWLLSSAMQKMIRQGNEPLAISAAYSLYQQDKHSFLRRIMTISCEDVGIAAPDAIARVMIATSSAAFRKRVGEVRVGLHLVQLLCRTNKTRAADELLIDAERSKRHRALREQFAVANDNMLMDCVHAERRPLVERCLALWYIAGMKRFTTELRPNRAGSMDKAIEVMRSLNAPAPLTEACISVIHKTQWPLSLFTPLIWLATQKQVVRIHHEELPAVQEVSGLPTSAVDWFTRTGRICYQRLRKAVPDLSSFTVPQISIAAFYGEGGKIDSMLTSPELVAIRQAGEAADAEFSGLTPSAYDALKNCLRENMGVLTDIRVQQLKNYLANLKVGGEA